MGPGTGRGYVNPPVSVGNASRCLLEECPSRKPHHLQRSALPQFPFMTETMEASFTQASGFPGAENKGNTFVREWSKCFIIYWDTCMFSLF